jgi:hypothetical protein
MARLSLPLAWCMPGVSKKTIWYSGVVFTARIRFRVVWGLGDIMAIFSPMSRFNKVDLPTLGAPIMETKPDFNLLGIRNLHVQNPPMSPFRKGGYFELVLRILTT